MIDTVEPQAHWTFDEGVTAAFEDMLARSIPQYEVMRGLVEQLAVQYRQPQSAIIDLGSSRGQAVDGLIKRYAGANTFYLTEVSPPMLQVLRSQYRRAIQTGAVTVLECDLRHEYPQADSCVTLSILTLQFTPMEYRQQIVQTVYDHLIPGGAFVLVEKVLGATAQLDRVLVDTYYQMKRENGYSEEQIQRKRMSLEGVLVPVIARWNEELLNAAGFRQVDCFWRWMNFAGWLAVKD